eukprot:TRINITY_DN6036_c0_g2_i1.p1 TRINITY_DN6036_c0_g2~~TRINITY_DN6036_c0_g2_i1.p1  ORF type:complete len:772 (+),score=223.63 TRINITY_DN6036_c0_g2_i1:192-2507(+)
MRILIKGGVWKNTEDEILKAAVMKYGTTQWSRISSLLVRKSAKQCKARWYEWLDPSIKKTEWSRDEEEKLLHLAKLMPCQWRTIAPIVGRTAAQCLEHYEKLLDQAQDKEDGVGDDPADDPRRLRPGEIDPNPESKPARPDPVDMDEDEKEMLSEARARLANTQGKKAKRKAREKQLEEARRLSTLQKKRELKAAGIELPKYKRRQRGVDYLNEVPFEIRPQAGFYGVGKAEQPAVPTFKQSMALQALEGKRRDEIEKEARDADKKRQKRKQEKDLPAAIDQISKMNDAEQVRKRSKLSLSTPQVSEAELEEITKLQDRGILGAGDGTEAARTLLGDYQQQTPSLAAGRTPLRTAQGDGDSLLQQAQDILALNQTKTPLDGGSNTPLHKESFAAEGATPQYKRMETPNPMATPFRNAAKTGTTPGATPRGGALGLSTPLRDELAINDPDTEWEQKKQKQSLQGILGALPKPSNDYQIDAAAFSDTPTDEDQPDGFVEEDAADIAERERKLQKQREDKAMAERSSTLKRKLPRPIDCTEDSLIESTKPSSAAYTLEKEMFDMICDDNTRFPVRGGDKSTETAAYAAKSKSSLAYFTPEELSAAKTLLQEELVNAMADKGIAEEDEANAAWNASYNDLLVLSSQQFASVSTATPECMQLSLNEEFDTLRQQMAKDAKKANKIEKRLMTLNAGYEKRSKQLIKEIQTMWEEYQKAQQQKACFEKLEAQEAVALPARITALTEDLQLVKKRESELQQRYARLKFELDEVRVTGNI